MFGKISFGKISVNSASNLETIPVIFHDFQPGFNVCFGCDSIRNDTSNLCSSCIGRHVDALSFAISPVVEWVRFPLSICHNFSMFVCTNVRSTGSTFARRSNAAVRLIEVVQLFFDTDYNLLYSISYTDYNNNSCCWCFIKTWNKFFAPRVIDRYRQTPA